MATFADIAEVRLQINDPAGYIAFVSVTNAAALPTTPVAQTAYRTEDNGAYQSKDTGTWVVQALRVSDARISAWIDADGVDSAVQKGYVAIMQKIGAEMPIVKDSSGAESTEYLSLKDRYNYYRNLIKDTAAQPPEGPGGKMIRTIKPVIAGANL